MKLTCFLCNKKKTKDKMNEIELDYFDIIVYQCKDKTQCYVL